VVAAPIRACDAGTCGPETEERNESRTPTAKVGGSVGFGPPVNRLHPPSGAGTRGQPERKSGCAALRRASTVPTLKQTCSTVQPRLMGPNWQLRSGATKRMLLRGPEYIMEVRVRTRSYHTIMFQRRRHEPALTPGKASFSERFHWVSGLKESADARHRSETFPYRIQVRERAFTIRDTLATSGRARGIRGNSR